MYNETQKQSFIDDQKNSVVTSKYFYSSLFNRSAEYEEGFEKDLSLFTSKQIELMYNALRLTSLNAIKVTNSVYKTYTDWCIANGTATYNSFATFNEDNLVNYLDVAGVKNQIVTKGMIYRWCEMLPNPSDRFLLLGLFEGVCGKEYCEFVHLTINDVFEDTLELNLYNRGRIKVSPRLIQFAIDSAETIKYYSISKGQKKVGQFKESDLIIKEYASVQDSTDDYWAGRRVYKKFLRITNYLFGANELSTKNVSDSGIYDMMKRRSEELGITDRDYLIYYGDEITKQYGRSIQAATFLRKYKTIG